MSKVLICWSGADGQPYRCPRPRSGSYQGPHLGTPGIELTRKSAFVRLGKSAALLLAAGLLMLLLAVTAWAQEVAIPPLTTWVTDTTNTLSTADKASLSQKLTALGREKGAQIAVLMVASTGNENIESYALRAFEQWKLGRKGIDDGILLVVAKDDRRLRIEVGYGLEGAVPDVVAGRIIREQIAPRFQAGQFSEGVIAGVDSLIALVHGEDLPPPAPGAMEGTEADDRPWVMLPALAFMALIMPLGVPTLFIGVFAGIAFGSVVIGVATAVGAAFIGLMVRLLGFGNTRQTIAASRRGGNRLGRAGQFGAGGFGVGGGFGGGFGGGGGSGGGGGGGAGGGGGSGGGGASGSW